MQCNQLYFGIFQIGTFFMYVRFSMNILWCESFLNQLFQRFFDFKMVDILHNLHMLRRRAEVTFLLFFGCWIFRIWQLTFLKQTLCAFQFTNKYFNIFIRKIYILKRKTLFILIFEFDLFLSFFKYYIEYDDGLEIFFPYFW